MKNVNLWLSALVLATIPVFTSQALITKPEVQFKTLEQIQADALEKFSSPGLTLTPAQERQKRLLRLTKRRDFSTNRTSVSGFAESDARNTFRARRGTTARRIGIRTRKGGGKSTSRRTLTPSELSESRSSRQAELLQQKAEVRSQLNPSGNTTRRHVSTSSDKARRDRIRALSRTLSSGTFNSQSNFDGRNRRSFTNTERRSSFNFVPQPGQIWGR